VVEGRVELGGPRTSGVGFVRAVGVMGNPGGGAEEDGGGDGVARGQRADRVEDVPERLVAPAGVLDLHAEEPAGRIGGRGGIGAVVDLIPRQAGRGERRSLPDDLEEPGATASGVVVGQPVEAVAGAEAQAEPAGDIGRLAAREEDSAGLAGRGKGDDGANGRIRILEEGEEAAGQRRGGPVVQPVRGEGVGGGGPDGRRRRGLEGFRQGRPRAIRPGDQLHEGGAFQEVPAAGAGSQAVQLADEGVDVGLDEEEEDGGKHGVSS
jgi:hypothetical protein